MKKNYYDFEKDFINAYNLFIGQIAGIKERAKIPGGLK